MSSVDEALASAGLVREQVAAAGIGSPGPLDVKAGIILFSANLNVKNYPIGPELSVALGRPVLVRNDVRVGGYAEHRLGAGRGYRDLIVTFVGTGIGGCVIQGGEIVAGATGNAGEIGHMIIKAGGPRCGCGARGCLEALASKTAIARRVDKAVRKGLPTVLGEKMTRKGGRLKSRDLADAVAAKDLVALKEVQRAAHYLGMALGSLINLIGPEIVIIGGGVAGALADSYIELVRGSARAGHYRSPGQDSHRAPAWATTPAFWARPCWPANISCGREAPTQVEPQKSLCRVGTAHRVYPRRAVPTLQETERPLRGSFHGSNQPGVDLTAPERATS